MVMLNIIFSPIWLFATLVAAVSYSQDTVTTDPQSSPPTWAGSYRVEMLISTTVSNATINLCPADSDFKEAPGKRPQSTLVNVTTLNYPQIENPEKSIAVLSCDPITEGYLTPSNILTTLVTKSLLAIILISPTQNWCSFGKLKDITPNLIFTVSSANDANILLKMMQTAEPQSQIRATINPNSSGSGGGTSSVAMSILYAITAIITALFITIIVTGTIRAHRNPERYGPRSGLGNQPAQSRAKGLARAVLDTIPIVKFSNNQQPKPDPEIQLEQANVATTTAQSASDVLPTAIEAPAADKGPDNGTTSMSRAETTAPDSSENQAGTSSVTGNRETDPDSLGCSICTEDFNFGDDVRVLPCQHQFHPDCIDPWLINVSGTCPLCRLDMQPSEPTGNDGLHPASLPPPLALDESTLGPSLFSQRERLFPRIFGANAHNGQDTLQASREARQATLASTTAVEASEADAESRRAKLSAKLKERFHILTRTQAS
ncbi:hypothetical protein VHEMI03821 [[Torrubiella] hemipterigena]|uniref:RING-type E3 ubiquitin transferase n=1 Tax=[Torrubiella] hemipterigena TaxID=1531966 RepID=A0A0A1TEI8_9HYPO|nr:hypothetical protein VHEMI03821 [[Torrubiella] hemipterigena]